MHVRVEEARNDVAPRRIDHLVSLVLAQSGDPAVRDCDVGVEPLTREHGQDAAAAHDDVGGLVASGHGEAPGEVVGHADDSPMTAKYAWHPWTCSRPATSKRRCA